MISFFRKIRQKFLQENRVTRYIAYAMGEILLVVIGILIALQVNNWNEVRKAAAQEQRILKILRAEFEYNQQELSRNIEKATALKVRADSLLNLFRLPKNDPSRERLRSLTNGLGGYSTFDPSNGALNNIISSGELNLLQNDSLKIRLSMWEGEVQDVKEDEKRIMEFGDRHLDPLRLEFLDLKTDTQFERNSQDLLENPQFENIVTRMSRGVDYIIQNYLLLETEIETILQLIDKEIKP